jgi:hypothetical protein
VVYSPTLDGHSQRKLEGFITKPVGIAVLLYISAREILD